MSIGIQSKDVTAVLLSDGWHIVGCRSFRLTALEHDGEVTLKGFLFQVSQLEDDSKGYGDYMCGPVSSILAIKTDAYFPDDDVVADDELGDEK